MKTFQQEARTANMLSRVTVMERLFTYILNGGTYTTKNLPTDLKLASNMVAAKGGCRIMGKTIIQKFSDEHGTTNDKLDAESAAKNVAEKTGNAVALFLADGTVYTVVLPKRGTKTEFFATPEYKAWEAWYEQRQKRWAEENTHYHDWVLNAYPKLLVVYEPEDGGDEQRVPVKGDYYEWKP